MYKIFNKFTTLKKAQTLILIDFSNFAYKTHFIFPETLEYGFLIQIINILNSLSFTKGHIIWCLDGYSKNRRNILLNYKMKKSKSIFDQTPLHRLISSWKKTTIAYHPELEADDIIAKYARESNKKTIILTGDRDLWVLKKYNTCSLYDNNKNMKCLITEDHLYSKFKLKSWEHIPIYKALFGDTSDNIKPGKPYRANTNFLLSCITDDIKQTVTQIQKKYKTWNPTMFYTNLKVIYFYNRDDIKVITTKKTNIYPLLQEKNITDSKILNYFNYKNC